VSNRVSNDSPAAERLSDEPNTRDEPFDAVLKTEDSVVESILRLPEFHEVAADLAERGIDALVDNAVVNEIPVIKTIKGLVRGAVGFHEAWLTKKLLTMFAAFGDVPDEEDVKRWKRRLADDKSTTETGERVLAVIDSVTSIPKAKLVGIAFRAYLDGECQRETFLRTCEMIDSALTEDLVYLLQTWEEGCDDAPCARVVAVGLMTDRSVTMGTEASKPPAPSAEGTALQVATKRHLGL
jgi:hypothetical protein